MRFPLRRERCFLLVTAALGLVGMHARADQKAVEAQMRKDITFLASDECEGRGVTTKGINLAANYIAREFQKAGLKPGAGGNSYFQPFTVPTGAAKLSGPARLLLKGPQGKTVEPEVDKDCRPIGLSGSGSVTGPLAFVGFGITAPDVGYDDYKGLDVAGKVVVILRRTPREQADAQGKANQPFAAGDHDLHAALSTKLVNADLHKAAAVLFVSDRYLAKDDDKLMSFADTASTSSPTNLPAFHVRRAVVEELLQASLGTGLGDLEEKIDHDLKPHSVSLPGWTGSVEAHVSHTTVPAKNIIGVAEGSGPLANETVVLGAHYDHLGYGGFGSLARSKEPAIHHGADDNASGDTVLMELARRFGSQSQRQGRRLVFIAFSGEERGLLGSQYYCSHPVFPLKDTVAMVNMDMVGRLRPDQESHKEKLVVYGTSTSPGFAELMDQLNQRFDFKLQKVPGANLAGERTASDHASFYSQKVPVLFFFTGNHTDYHRPTDTADKINVHGMAEIADLVGALVDRLAQQGDRPQYVKVAVPVSPMGRATGNMPRLGVMPSYGDDKEGVLLDGVSPNGPAEKAGLKEGDRIVELGGLPVKNLEAYMVLMSRHKRGEPLDVGLVREGKKMTLKVTPE